LIPSHPKVQIREGKTKGLGLYKYIETENEKIVAKAKQDIEDYRRLNEKQYIRKLPRIHRRGPDLTTPSIKKVPDDSEQLRNVPASVDG
jgi:hypothetical protein